METDTQGSMLTTRELVAILWRGKWILLAGALLGLGWALLTLPQGGGVVTGTVQIQASDLASGQAMSEVDWLKLYLSVAGFPDTGKAPTDAAYTITTTVIAGNVTLVFSGPAEDEASVTAAMIKLAAAEDQASDAYLALVRERLAALSRVHLAPAAVGLVYREALGLQAFVDTAKPPIFHAVVGRVREVATNTISAYVRRTLLGLAAGVIAVIALHLLRVLVSGRKTPATAAFGG